VFGRFIATKELLPNWLCASGGNIDGLRQVFGPKGQESIAEGLPEDGARFLVERLWPREMKKDALRMDAWCKNPVPCPRNIWQSLAKH
jgi:hypothetical protein